eukprot:105695-Rhodomonas_salina.3
MPSMTSSQWYPYLEPSSQYRISRKDIGHPASVPHRTITPLCQYQRSQRTIAPRRSVAEIA